MFQKMAASCSICTISNPNYKCPKCSAKYCSVKCYQKHKKTPCSTLRSDKNVSHETDGQSFTTDNTVTLDRLHLLEQSNELKNLLKHESLRSHLLAINASPNPARDLQLAMNDPAFDVFATTCLNIVEPLMTPLPTVDDNTNTNENVFDNLEELLRRELHK